MTYANESHEALKKIEEKIDDEFSASEEARKKEEERKIADMYMRRLEAAQEIGKQALLSKEREASGEVEDVLDLKDSK